MHSMADMRSATPQAMGTYTGSWIVMMAAMMLPGLVPAAAQAPGRDRLQSS